MLQLVVLGIVTGIAFLTITSKAVKTCRDICEFVQDMSMMMVNWAMMFVPLAVFSLMIKAISTMGMSGVLGIAYYALSVVCGLLCLLCLYLIIVTFVAKRDPLQFLKDIRSAQIVAFSSSSSSTTMPVSMKVAENKLKIDKKISSFSIPVGATVNMDGTALYQATAAIFLCQIFKIDLSVWETVLLIFTTVVASIGTPALPGAGLIVLNIYSNIYWNSNRWYSINFRR